MTLSCQSERSDDERSFLHQATQLDQSQQEKLKTTLKNLDKIERSKSSAYNKSFDGSVLFDDQAKEFVSKIAKKVASSNDPAFRQAAFDSASPSAKQAIISELSKKDVSKSDGVGIDQSTQPMDQISKFTVDAAVNRTNSYFNELMPAQMSYQMVQSNHLDSAQIQMRTQVTEELAGLSPQDKTKYVNELTNSLHSGISRSNSSSNNSIFLARARGLQQAIESDNVDFSDQKNLY